MSGNLISSQVICDTSMISANVRVLLGEWDIFKFLLGILTDHLTENIPQKILKIHKINKIYPEHNSNIIHKIVNITITMLQTFIVFQIITIQEKMS